MLSTISLWRLSERILGAEVNSAFAKIDLIVSDVQTDSDALTVDQLATRYLAPSVTDSFSGVDFEVEELSLGLDAKEVHMHLHAKGLSLVILLLFLAATVIGVGPVMDLLRSVLGR
jgi:hypothetical protein